MAEKIATREAYGNALAEFGEKYDFVVLDADLAAATKTSVFKKKYPARHINCGIDFLSSDFHPVLTPPFVFCSTLSTDQS